MMIEDYTTCKTDPSHITLDDGACASVSTTFAVQAAEADEFCRPNGHLATQV